MQNLRFYSIVVLLIALAADCRSEEIPLTAEQTAFFEQKIRPLLIERCNKCHAESHHIKGGLRLDTRSGWRVGGDSGPAAVPGKPDESLLIKAVSYADPDLKMPPAGKLSDAEIAILVKWVEIGAPDPRDSAASIVRGKTQPASASNHWAYQTLQIVSLPVTHNDTWSVNDVDRFILTKLSKNGLQPSPDADRYHWLRRVSLDLTGLPPTPDEVQSFVADQSVHAEENVVDRLIASPAFGERWARPWLDLVGYADQIGSANNVPAELAWRYRDYVIRAMNADKPFNEFVREQIAGDLLDAATIEQRQDQLTATGFLVLGNVNIVESDKLVMRMDLVDQQIEKIGKAFLGMTLNCARCHDHKFDPITLNDYYGLAGIFASTESTYRADRGVWSAVTRTQLPETLDQFNHRQAALRAHEQKVVAVQNEREGVEAKIKALDQQIKLAKDESAAAVSQFKPLAELENERSELAGKLPGFEQRLWHLNFIEPTTPTTFAVKDDPVPTDARIQVRGNPHTLGAEVPRGFVRVATHGTVPFIPKNQSGRLQLSEWLSKAASPLMSRVTVNRFWSRLFGKGIVGSVDYFGVRGDLPTHPELIDYLAQRFIADGWSQKRLIRLLALSRTYRQRTEADDSSRAALAVDPNNQFYWRMSPRRLDAEMLRDSVLAVSGSLEPCAGGPGLALEFPENVGGLNPKDVNPISFSLSKFRDNQQRVRTVYLPVVRSSDQRGPAEVLNFFDFSQPARMAGDRPTTAVTSQTLFLLNGPLLKNASKKLAEDLQSQPTLTTDSERLNFVFLKVLNRLPTADELSLAETYLKTSDDSASGGTETNAVVDVVAAWQRLIQALMASNEFLFRL